MWPVPLSMLDRGTNRVKRVEQRGRGADHDHEHGRQEELQLLGLERPALAIHGRQVAQRLDERALLLPGRQRPPEQGPERPGRDLAQALARRARPARPPRQAAGPRRSSPRCPWPRPRAPPPAASATSCSSRSDEQFGEAGRLVVREHRPHPGENPHQRPGRRLEAGRAARPPPGEAQEQRARPATPATSRGPAPRPAPATARA